MGYTALRDMQQQNKKLYGVDFPAEPGQTGENKAISNIEQACQEFLYTRCEGLCFCTEKANLLDRDGKSITVGQIPYNMEKDIDRLCLANAIHRFMKSGVAQDAFDIYFCYLEMFVGNYAKSKKMIEMLAEFESNASALLMKHRDHYSHSAYVFVLGLAIYQKNKLIRRSFGEHYGLAAGPEADHTFMRYWGMAALFHDIGYPFELPFEQVKSYFGEEENVPFICYGGLDRYLMLSKDAQAESVNRLLAQAMSEKLWKTYGNGKNRKEYADYLEAVLDKRPVQPDRYMDHAYFSAVVLMKQIFSLPGMELGKLEMDVLTAIALHNSLYKFVVADIKNTSKNIPLSPELHPLAYMLMLCDELQCWDRISYGKNSRQELHAMWCDLEFDGNAIKAHYFFDRSLEGRKGRKGTYQKMTNRTKDGGPVDFISDIEQIVAINQPNRPLLELDTEFITNNRDTKTYISGSSFLHLYNFAVALNARYNAIDLSTANACKIMEAAFDNLSLEYKLSNIMQAKAFAGYLDKIDCFYTDKPVQYELMDQFSQADMDIIGPLEHERWLNEKLFMGWTCDSCYENSDLLEKTGKPQQEWKQESKKIRELTRTHKLIIEDYNQLDKAEQDKDTKPMNRMLELVSEYDGLRLYRLHR